MNVTDYESNLDARVAFKRLTGLHIRLTPFEALVKIAVKSDTEILVQIVTFTVDERRTSHVLTARGTRLIQFIQANGTWAQAGKAITVWDTDFQPVSFNLYGAGKSPAEWLASREFARMAGRVGTSRNPLDSHRRVSQGYTNKRMGRHWA